jgi:hypothetical protein
MNKKIFITAILSSLVTFNSCNSPTETDQQFKHPREMTWSADTLMPDPEAIQLIPESILAFSPKDIWLVCYSDVARRLLWHYDGIEWKPVESGGGKRYTDLAGYNSEDIWLGGYSGEKAHFTHKKGNTFTRYDFDIVGQILDMTMDPQGNIWACGRNGIIMKYDKTKWITDTLKMSFNTDTEYFLKAVEYYHNKIFALLSTLNKQTLIETYYYAYGDLKNWTLGDSVTYNSPSMTFKFGHRELYSTKWGELYSMGQGAMQGGVWKYTGNGWQSHLKISGAINGMFGQAENYLFALGDFQKVYFYDGTIWEDIKDLFKLDDPYFVFKTGCTDGKEVFIIGYTFSGWPQKTIIWHGK